MRAYYQQHRDELKTTRRERYANDPAMRERVRRYNLAYRSKNRARLREQDHRRWAETKQKITDRRRARKIQLIALLGGKCYDCGAEFSRRPEVFDFDHRDPAQKLIQIADILRTGSWERALAEVKKCDLVCANCHRTRTVRRTLYDELGGANTRLLLEAGEPNG